MMEETGVLSMFIPELACCRNVTQADSRGFHEYDILDHNFYACDGAPQNNVIVRIAALFHDLGKFDTRKCVMERVPGQEDKKVEVIHFRGFYLAYGRPYLQSEFESQTRRLPSLSKNTRIPATGYCCHLQESTRVPAMGYSIHSRQRTAERMSLTQIAP